MKSQTSKAQQFSISKRIEQARCLSAFEASIYFASYTALVIATGIFLWHPKEKNPANKAVFETMCNDKYVVQSTANGNIAFFNQPCSKTVNVFERFTIVLQLYFAFYVVQWFRMLLIYFAICFKSSKIASVFDTLGCG